MQLADVLGLTDVARPRGGATAALSVSIPAVRAGRAQPVALAPFALPAAGTLSARLGCLGASSSGTPARVRGENPVPS